MNPIVIAIYEKCRGSFILGKLYILGLRNKRVNVINCLWGYFFYLWSIDSLLQALREPVGIEKQIGLTKEKKIIGTRSVFANSFLFELPENLEQVRVKIKDIVPDAQKSAIKFRLCPITWSTTEFKKSTYPFVSMIPLRHFLRCLIIKTISVNATKKDRKLVVRSSDLDCTLQLVTRLKLNSVIKKDTFHHVSFDSHSRFHPEGGWNDTLRAVHHTHTHTKHF